MHPSVLYHHTTALSHKAHHVIAPFYGQPLPICRGRCSPLSEKRNKNAVFLHIRERQHSSLSVQISPLLAITFLYHPKDFFLYRAAALFEYPLIKRNQRATVINFKNHADSLFLSQICFLHLLHSLHLLLFVSQLFQFFAHGQLLLSDNRQNKSDQLFTVDRLLSAYSFFKSSYASQNCFLPVIFD